MLYNGEECVRTCNGGIRRRRHSKLLFVSQTKFRIWMVGGSGGTLGCLVKGHLTFGVTTTAKKFAYSNKHTHVTLTHTHIPTQMYVYKKRERNKTESQTVGVCRDG